VIVLTGAAGFIGSCILSRLNQVGSKDILIVDHLDDSDSLQKSGQVESNLKKANLRNKEYQQYFDKKDFLKLVLADKLPAQIDFILHIGACSSTTLQDARYFRENNFEYSCHLAKWALARNVRFIYASSAATYGDGSCGYSDDHTRIRQCKPLNLYGESKQKFDEWVLDNAAVDKVVGLKFFNVFGPNEYHKGDMRSVIAKAYTKVVEEGKMALFKSYRKEFADGEQQRDFIYVKDAVDIVMFFVEHPDIHGIYNVGTGKARSWNDLASALFSAVGQRPNIQYIDMPEAIRPRYQYFTQAEMEKLQHSGYQKPFTELEDAIKDYVKYLSRHTYL